MKYDLRMFGEDVVRLENCIKAKDFYDFFFAFEVFKVGSIPGEDYRLLDGFMKMTFNRTSDNYHIVEVGVYCMTKKGDAKFSFIIPDDVDVYLLYELLNIYSLIWMNWIINDFEKEKENK